MYNHNKALYAEVLEIKIHMRTRLQYLLWNEGISEKAKLKIIYAINELDIALKYLAEDLAKEKKEGGEMELKEAWLKCKISAGMFSNEYTIHLNSSKQDISFFAHQSLVDQKNEAIRVSLIDCGKDFCTVYLPVEPFEGIGKTVVVPRGNILTYDSK